MIALMFSNDLKSALHSTTVSDHTISESFPRAPLPNGPSEMLNALMSTKSRFL